VEAKCWSQGKRMKGKEGDRGWGGRKKLDNICKITDR
jgi:hypothetical protein